MPWPDAAVTSRRAFLAAWAGASLVRAAADPLILESDLALMKGRYTAPADFYVRNHHEIVRSPEQAVLRVEGEIARPVRLTLADLARLKRVEVGAVLECAGNPVSRRGLVGNGIWNGWSMKEVLALTRPSGSAGFLHLFGRDGFARSVPMDRVNGDAILATDLGSARLDPVHGAPWRALFPGWYGMDSVKWLERIVVARAPFADNDNEYVEMTPAASVGVVRRPLPGMLVKSVILSPREAGTVERGRVEIRGLAWCGDGAISKVEVSGDRDTHWQAAELSPGGAHEWVLWRAAMDWSTPGAAEVVCRASDTGGRVQPERRDPERLDDYGQNRIHRVRFLVV
jgi:DMSO/TMAO reductase YedYZ molybdopterin-dependent catalytic subunit